MEKIYPRNYKPVPKADNDGDPSDSDTTLTVRLRRRSVQQFLKRNLATITITGLLLILLLLVITLIAAITLQPVRQALSLEHSSVYSGSHHDGQRQCLPTASRTRLSCGNSTDEAESLGCTYDPLSACWLHQECPHDYVKEFTEFNNGKPFIYYYDQEMTRQMKDYDEVGRNVNGFYWTSNREHLVHCLYLLRRAHDVHMRGDRLDTMLADQEHTDHCTNMLANWLRRRDPALDELGTQGQTHCFMSCS
ncbi:hypothetical protein BDV38DRAFT_278974 [Aspergillus pseudotamarii]|uniref:Uncharacterized protein n=1 Tax=Aspergillus pseudotamarii TaxID=132259 RepID=A0A5N6T5Q5_ASPPS|nr:uncharacterized protein BDV38DRAFT_278974 [Aspergillus pseudotamarii]KAE8141620.1 hypothetical protein BDV38DRAFT_278974 [Aspergillus pseudotamarii]